MAHPPISRTFTVVCGPIAADSHAHCYNDMAGDPYKITGVAESRNRGGAPFFNASSPGSQGNYFL